MSIYTRTGDTGRTQLADGTAVAKSSRRVQAYGTLDEATCSVGFARRAVSDVAIDEILRFVQHRLMNCSAALASPVANPDPFVTHEDVAAIEAAIDRIEESAGGLHGFVLPSGCEAATRLHLARTVVRRAERVVVSLSEEPDRAVEAALLAFLNRVSDLLFAAARAENTATGFLEEPWDRHAKPPAR